MYWLSWSTHSISHYWVWVRMTKTSTPICKVSHSHMNYSPSGYQQQHLWGCCGIQRNDPEVIHVNLKHSYFIAKVHLLFQKLEMLETKFAISKWGSWISHRRTSLYPWVCEFELCRNHYNFLNLNPSLIFDKFMQTNTTLCEFLLLMDVFNKLDLDPPIPS